MTTANILEVMEKINQTAQNNIQDERFIKKIAIGKVVRQGDIYIHCVGFEHKSGDLLKSNQLAQGTSKGSRHVAESPAQCYNGTTLPSYCNNAFLGPLIKSGQRFIISHPEHAHISLPAGCYQITHQMDARTLERVRD